MLDKALDLASVIRTHQTTVWRYLRLLGCEAALADDLTQETFLSLVERPPGALPEEKTGGYLRRVAKHLFIDEMRRRKRRATSLLDEADLAWNEVSGDDEGESWRRALRQCLEGVQGRVREVLVLRYQDGVSLSHLATRLGMKGNGIKSLLQRVKTKLRDCVERRMARTRQEQEGPS